MAVEIDKSHDNLPPIFQKPPEFYGTNPDFSVLDQGCTSDIGNFPDKPKVIFDPNLGGIIFPGELHGSFTSNIKHGAQFETARRFIVAIGYVSNATNDSVAIPLVFATGAFTCAQLEKRFFRKALAVADDVWSSVGPNGSPVYNVNDNPIPPVEKIDRNDGGMDYFIPLEKLLTLMDHKGDLKVSLADLKHEINLSVLYLTGASLSAHLISIVAAIPFVLTHYSLSGSVATTTTEIRDLLNELVQNVVVSNTEVDHQRPYP